METYKNGEKIISDLFKIEVEGVETAWKLEAFPNGKQKDGEDTTGAVSLFLYPANNQALNKPFSFSIGFVNEEKSRLMKGKGDHCFKDNKNGWGWLKLITHQTLKNITEKLLPDDKLSIFCVMKFRDVEENSSGTKRPTNISKDASFNSADDDTSSDFLDMLTTGDLSDVVLVCDGEEIPAHSFILGAKSPVFRAAFIHNMKERETGKVIIDGIEKETVRDMLTFIYSNKIDNLDEKANKLLIAADRYDLKTLKLKCELSLCGSLSISNCLDYLIMADLYSADRLKDTVIKFAVGNCREVVTMDDWKEKLLSFPDIFAELFDALAWQPHGKKSKTSHFEENFHWQ
jgi:speckle-type POZ protein